MNRILHLMYPEEPNDPLFWVRLQIQCEPDSDDWEMDDYLAGEGIL